MVAIATPPTPASPPTLDQARAAALYARERLESERTRVADAIERVGHSKKFCADEYQTLVMQLAMGMEVSPQSMAATLSAAGKSWDELVTDLGQWAKRAESASLWAGADAAELELQSVRRELEAARQEADAAKILPSSTLGGLARANSRVEELSARERELQESADELVRLANNCGPRPVKVSPWRTDWERSEFARDLKRQELQKQWRDADRERARLLNKWNESRVKHPMDAPRLGIDAVERELRETAKSLAYKIHLQRQAGRGVNERLKQELAVAERAISGVEACQRKVADCLKQLEAMKQE